MLSEGAQQIVDKYPWMQEIINKKEQERSEEEWLKRELAKECREVIREWLYNNGGNQGRVSAIKKAMDYAGLGLREARDLVDAVALEIYNGEDTKKKINKAFPYWK